MKSFYEKYKAEEWKDTTYREFLVLMAMSLAGTAHFLPHTIKAALLVVSIGCMALWFIDYFSQ